MVFRLSIIIYLGNAVTQMVTLSFRSFARCATKQLKRKEKTKKKKKTKKKTRAVSRAARYETAKKKKRAVSRAALRNS